MDSDINTLSWWALTRLVLFSPRAHFAQVPGDFSYRSSALYLVKTALVVSVTNALVFTVVFDCALAAFASILGAFIVIFGVLLTPLIAIAANIPPEQVPNAVEAFARTGGMEATVLSAKLGALIFLGFFGTIMVSTCLQSGIAHGVARLLGCAGSYRATAAVYAFGSAAWMLSVVPVVHVIAPIYGAVLDIFGMRHLHKLSNAETIVAVVIAAVLPAIVFILYSSMSN